jgi:signal transduction histidine kinase
MLAWRHRTGIARCPTLHDPGARQLLALDCVAAMTYMALLLVLRRAPTPDPPPVGSPGWAADALVVAMGAPLAVRRLAPLPVLAAVLTASVVALPLGVLRDPFLATAFALYPVALTRARQAWIPVAAATALLVTGAIGTTPVTPYWWWSGPGLIVIGWLLIAGSWMLGSAVREQRAFAARVAEQLADHAVTTERLRIARELHDVVAHSIGIIAVKAAVANRVAKTRPGEAGDALRQIETSSRAALAEMRQMLSVLRSPDPQEQATELAPTPGPADLPALVDTAATAGLYVKLEMRGDERVSEALGLTIYRIVQEALTNAAKHAARATAPERDAAPDPPAQSRPTRCRVQVDATGDEATIDVTNDGPRVPPARSGGGHGLIGMRERVALYGGTLAAGPRPDGGFQVTARIPIDPSPGRGDGAAR